MHLLAAPAVGPTPLAAIIDFIRAWPLIGTVLLAVIPLYWPSLRWSRRLKSDGDICSKLPPSPERERFEASLVAQARRLYMYRMTIGNGKYAVRSALAVSYASALPLTLLIDPQSILADGWPTVFLLLAVAVFAIYLVSNVWRGRTPAHGLTPYGLLVRERVRRRDKRASRLHRLGKRRRKAFRKGRTARERASRLGFRTQVDPLAMVASDDFRHLWSDYILYQQTPPTFRSTYEAAVRVIDAEFEKTTQTP